MSSLNSLYFYRIFEIAPAAIQLFPKFKDVPIENLEKNEDFRHHALQVPEAVGLAVSYLGDLESLYSVLKDLGALHADFGIQDAHFEVSTSYNTGVGNHNLLLYLMEWGPDMTMHDAQSYDI